MLDNILEVQEDQGTSKGRCDNEKKVRKDEETITFTEWKKVQYETRKGKKASRSRKVHVTLPMTEFILLLIKELKGS